MPSHAVIAPTSVVASPIEVPTAASHAEVIAGYTLQERLGAGGYGEVWSATGPGGLRKAVKILHGRFDGPQADVEMKALSCVRELRHPFLLNVERAEVVDGRLIIVTELADRSLEECFQASRRDGKCGIPRDDLLAYLQDAAEALDFMYERHGLAHLDIKPENLFLQDNHVKVGDLGLVKDIRRSNISQINGFTALYAPPEIFDGKPGRNSDQYSLAIVYQVMLTGIPPFDGRTTARLAAQHLSIAPDLSSLGPADRPAVARALSRNPAARFASCKQFIEELSRRRPKARPAAQPAAATTAELEDCGAGDSAAAPLGPHSTDCIVQLPLLQTTPLAAPPAAAMETSYRPTIVVGLGGLGARVLNDLRRRLADRFGPDQDLSAYRLLSIDTDVPSASKNHSAEDPSAALRVEPLPIPLRDANEYRADSRQPLDWLSRRWLFNIPRSRQVDGLRPLGRLALVDHHEKIRSRLRHLISEIIADDARQATSDRTGLSLAAGPPDVFVVASISGGTGAGGVLDLGYLVRDTLAELKLRSGTLHGILLHGTSGAGKLSELQNANAISCLEELKYFTTAGLGYPGDRTTGLPQSENGPFDHTYVIPLGDNLNDEDYDRESRAIAEYLYAGMATKAQECLAEWRRFERMQRHSTSDGSTIRTFSAAVIDHFQVPESMAKATALCRMLVRKWHINSTIPAEGAPARTPHVIDSTQALLAQLQITEEQLTEKMNTLLYGETQNRLNVYFAAKWQRLSQPPHGGQASLESLFRSIDADLASGAVHRADEGVLASREAARFDAEPLRLAAQRSAAAIRNRILELLDTSSGRLAAACECVGDIMWHLNTLASDWTRVLKNMQGEREQMSCQPRSARGPLDSQAERHDESSSDAIRSCCLHYALLYFCEEVFRSFIEHVDHIRRAVGDVGAELMLLRGRLGLLDNALDSASAGIAVSAPRDDRSAAVDVEAFDEKLRRGETFLLSKLVQKVCDLPALADTLRKAALDFLLECAVLNDIENTESGDKLSKSAALESSLILRLSNLGGGRRVLALAPEADSLARWKQKLTEAFGDCVSIQPSLPGPLFLVCELEGVSLERMISRLTYRNPRLVEVASRLRTRIDIDW